MAEKIQITIDDKVLNVDTDKSILEVCRESGIDIPTMCHLKGVTEVGACRLCLVEIEGVSKLLPACTTKVAFNQKIRTQSEKLEKYRLMITELLFSERNHICSVCVSNGSCELQDLGYKVGMEHVRFSYLFQTWNVDASHDKFVMDHNRCILCTRCVRACAEVEGAYCKNVTGRGYKSKIITDFDQPWGESDTCTECGKCVQVCPTGALWPKDIVQGQIEKRPEMIAELVEKRKMDL